MPRIFDNISLNLGEALRSSFANAYRADICVGYFNLRGWGHLVDIVEDFVGGEGAECRLLVGRNIQPSHEVERLYATGSVRPLDRLTVVRERNKLLQDYRQQLLVGGQSEEQLRALQQLRRQMESGKVRVKMHAHGALHAKLYIAHRDDADNPRTAFLGSSNLTMRGLQGSGELNIDVLEHAATETLSRWFEDRWEDPFCIDITPNLIELIKHSWGGDTVIPPYHIYLKMIHQLSRQAREGIRSFSIPRVFRDTLLEFQEKAVQIAAQYLNERRGVLIGDVVGLGKTMMASALIRIMLDDCGFRTLILCPANLEKMWQSYDEAYGLGATIMSTAKVTKKLGELAGMYQVILIDESHNLRNREGKRYAAIRDFINQHGSRCILLSATPYNKTYLDLSNQLRLFVDEKADLGVRPEEMLRVQYRGGERFALKEQKDARTLEAFEMSEFAADWRLLISQFMVRRTRSFIKKYYAKRDANGEFYLEFSNGSRARIPKRRAARLEFYSDADDPEDRYARLYSEAVVDVISDLALPRYGLGNYVKENLLDITTDEKRIIRDLTTGGRRLIGFSRTNLFKRLESSGEAFLISIQRHVARNRVFVHALEHDLEIPIGTQDAAMLFDTRQEDVDANVLDFVPLDSAPDDDADSANPRRTSGRDKRQAGVAATGAKNGSETRNGAGAGSGATSGKQGREQYNLALLQEIIGREEELHSHQPGDVEDIKRRNAGVTYEFYAKERRHKFRWLRAELFNKQLLKDLLDDCHALEALLQEQGAWQAAYDNKLQALLHLIRHQHPNEKILVFSQFADTITYLDKHLRPVLEDHELGAVSGVKGDPATAVQRFSPRSNNASGKITPQEEHRVLLATDMLSEGQNLQDAHIIVNFDLPWAIIRLIQRAGRVDRIGQQSGEILCYTFWPAAGVEQIITLRERLQERLAQNAEVVGADEIFFNDQADAKPLHDLYNESSGILDDEDDDDNDLVSQALGIWDEAIKRDPSLAKTIPALPDKSFSARHLESAEETDGLLVYVQTGASNYGLVRLDSAGEVITESHTDILRMAACRPDTAAAPRAANHFELVNQAVNVLENKQGFRAGQLGPANATRRRLYDRVKNMIDYSDTLFNTLPDEELRSLQQILEALYNAPLHEQARRAMARQLRAKIDNVTLKAMLLELHEDARLVRTLAETENFSSKIICSLGLIKS